MDTRPWIEAAGALLDLAGVVSIVAGVLLATGRRPFLEGLNLEAAGVAMVTVHGRTREQGYKGQAEYETVAAVKAALGIPVVANGDIDSPEKALAVLQATGADAVMIGRAAQGRPWLVGDIAHALATGSSRPAPDMPTRGALAREHLDGLLTLMGAEAGLRHARKHLAAYAQHHAKPDCFDEAQRLALLTGTNPNEVRALLSAAFTNAAEKEAA